MRLPIKPPVVNRSGRIRHDVERARRCGHRRGRPPSTYLWGYGPDRGARPPRDPGRAWRGHRRRGPVLRRTRLWRRTLVQIQQWGRQGLAVIAMSGIDTAVWDIVRKATNQPLAHLLGANADRVPVYASEGLWLTDDPLALGEAEDLVTRGAFRAVKMRLGARGWPTTSRPSEPCATQSADVGLMIDVNQGWDVTYAIKIGRRPGGVRPRLAGGADPARRPGRARPHRGGARHADRLGEKLYTPRGFREAIEARAFDIAMPVSSASAASPVDAHRRPGRSLESAVCSHLFPEASVHLMAAAPTGIYLEHVPWAEPLFRERLELVDGMALVPRPGLGFTWDESSIERLLVSRSPVADEWTGARAGAGRGGHARVLEPARAPRRTRSWRSSGRRTSLSRRCCSCRSASGCWRRELHDSGSPAGAWWPSSAALEAFYVLDAVPGVPLRRALAGLPRSRGASAPILVPLLAALFLGRAAGSGPGEAVSGWSFFGIVAMHLTSVRWRNRQELQIGAVLGQLGTRYALLTGLVIAAYSTLDKVGVSLVYRPALYGYLLFARADPDAVAGAAWPLGAVAPEWELHRRASSWWGCWPPPATG